MERSAIHGRYGMKPVRIVLADDHALVCAGGTLQLESAPGAGTRVRATLPLARGPA